MLKQMNTLVLATGAMSLLPALACAQKPLPFGLSAVPTPQVTAVAPRPALRTSGTTFTANQQYTFALHGPAIASPVASRLGAELGTIVVDTNGNIIAGEVDIDSTIINLAAYPISGGSITLNPDLTGTLTIQLGGVTQVFSLAAAVNNGTITSAGLLEDDGIAGLSGTLIPQPKMASAPQGQFSLSLSGETFEAVGVPDAVGVSGTLTLSGQTASGQASVYVGDAGHNTFFFSGFVPFSGGSTTGADPLGRTTISLTLPNNAGSAVFAAYPVSATMLNLVAINPVSASSPVVFGTAQQ